MGLCEEAGQQEGLGFEKEERREGEVVMSIAPGKLANELCQVWHGLQNSLGHGFQDETEVVLP